MKIIAIFLTSVAVLASGAILSEITKFSDIFGGGVTRLSEDVMELNVKLFYTEIELWLKLGYQTNLLKRMIKLLAFSDSFQRSGWRISSSGLASTAKCIVCRSVSKTVLKLRKTGVSENAIMNTIASLCADLNLASKSVCEGVVRLHMPILFYIIDRRPELTSRDFCGVLLQSESCSQTSDVYEWTVEVDAGPSQHIQYEETSETVNIIQLSDIHYDPKYEPYGNPLCDDTACCRVGQNGTNNGRQIAGYWGDYNNCDTPWHSVVDTFNHVEKIYQGKDMIYFTGDIIDHGIWETTQEFNMESINKVYDRLKAQFPTIPIFPILGNHEPHPLNVFAPSSVTNETFSTKWLYEHLADKWISLGWLPESTRSTMIKGGYYTTVARKGLRIIALNNNVCYTFNWWILYEPNDPDDQLKWLHETLLQAENQGEFVHILAHLPPGWNECLRSWSKSYRKIINRFAHIIAAEFNGHTHKDEMRVYYSLENRDDVVSVAWNGGSITTYSNLNPNYRVYTVNRNNYHVEEVDTWIYNMTEANENPDRSPDWFISYSFKEAYGLQDLSMKSLDDWLKRLALNETLALQYNANFVKYAEPSMKDECDAKCIKDIICSIVTTDMSDEKDCERLSKYMTDKIMGNPRFFNLKVNKLLPNKLLSKLPNILKF